MFQYLGGLKQILDQGKVKSDRTGTGTISYFGMMQRYILADGFPLVTTKRVPFKSVLSELLWFLEGSGSERRLAELLYGEGNIEGKKTIWTQNAEAPYWIDKAQYEGDLGRVYGVQWRNWTNQFGEVTDQLLELVKGIKQDPHGRRHIITAWNPGELSRMALPPCHCFAQFNVVDNKLDCLMYQRSNDFFLGCPFNIASYALLTHMVAQVCGLQVGELIHTTGDAHLYTPHIELAKDQLTRASLPLPKLKLNPNILDITKFTMNDIELVGYQSHPPIAAIMMV
jgi:thymidylate synthase